MTLTVQRGKKAVDVAGLLEAAGAESFAGAKVLEIPLAKIERNPDQPRIEFDKDELERLATSIWEHGQLQPCVVRPHPDKPGIYQLVDGERRWRAAQMVKKGFSSYEIGSRPPKAIDLLCIVRDVSSEDMLEIALRSNIERVGHNDAEAILAMKKLSDRGWSNRRIGGLFAVKGKSMSDASVSERLALTKLSPAAWDAFADGKFLFSEARSLMTWQRRLEELKAGTRQLENYVQTQAGMKTLPVHTPNPNLDVNHIMRLTVAALINKTPDDRRYQMSRLNEYGDYTGNITQLFLGSGKETGAAIRLATNGYYTTYFDPAEHCTGCPFYLSTDVAGLSPVHGDKVCFNPDLFSQHNVEAKFAADQEREALAEDIARVAALLPLSYRDARGADRDFRAVARDAVRLRAWVADNLFNAALLKEQLTGKTFDSIRGSQGYIPAPHVTTDITLADDTQQTIRALSVVVAGLVPPRPFEDTPQTDAGSDDVYKSTQFFEQAIRDKHITHLAIAQGILAYLNNGETLRPDSIINIVGTPNMTARYKVLQALGWTSAMAHEKVRLHTFPNNSPAETATDATHATPDVAQIKADLDDYVDVERRRQSAQRYYAERTPDFQPPSEWGPVSRSGGNTLSGYQLAGLGHRYGLGEPVGTGTPPAVIERYEQEYQARIVGVLPPAPTPSDPYQWLVEKALRDGEVTPDGIERAIIEAREVCELNAGTMIPLTVDLSIAVRYGVLKRMGYGQGTHLGSTEPRTNDVRDTAVQKAAPRLDEPAFDAEQLEADLYHLWVYFTDMTEIEEAIPDDKIAAFIATLDPNLTPVARLKTSVNWLLELFCTVPV